LHSLSGPFRRGGSGTVGGRVGGSWNATLDIAGDRPHDAVVKIAGDSGTIRIFSGRSHARSNPCFGREFPLSVRQDATGALSFDVRASKVLAGCRDVTATLQRVDDKTLRGDLGDLGTISMTRE
jgi:hypothetical protein